MLKRFTNFPKSRSKHHHFDVHPSTEKTQNCQIYSQVLQCKTVVWSNDFQIFQNPAQNTVILMYIYPRMEQNQKFALKSTSNDFQIFQNPAQNTVILMYIYPRMEQNQKFALKSTYQSLICTTYIWKSTNTTHTMSKAPSTPFFYSYRPEFRPKLSG